MVLVIGSGLFLSNPSNRRDWEALQRLLADNYVFLWVEGPINIEVPIKFHKIYNTLEDGRRKNSRIREDFADDKKLLSCPYIVVDYAVNRWVYEGYDAFIDLNRILIRSGEINEWTFSSDYILDIAAFLVMIEEVYVKFYRNKPFKYVSYQTQYYTKRKCDDDSVDADDPKKEKKKYSRI